MVRQRGVSYITMGVAIPHLRYLDPLVVDIRVCQRVTVIDRGRVVSVAVTVRVRAFLL